MSTLEDAEYNMAIHKDASDEEVRRDNNLTVNFMELGRALGIVHELADQNKLQYEDADNNDELLLQVEEHQLALDTVEDFIVNHFGDD